MPDDLTADAARLGAPEVRRPSLWLRAANGKAGRA